MKNMDDLILFAISDGDASVGIPGAQWEIKNFLLDDPGDREEIRADFKLAFGWLADPVRIVFSDELQSEELDAPVISDQERELSLELESNRSSGAALPGDVSFYDDFEDPRGRVPQSESRGIIDLAAVPKEDL